MTKQHEDNVNISSEGHNHNRKGKDIDIDGGVSAWGKGAAVGLAAAGGLSLVAAAPFVVTQIRSPLPYMATPRRKVVAALDAIASGRLKTGCGLNGGGVSGSASAGGGGGGDGGGGACQAARRRRRRYMHLTDLGSGDGEVVLAAASATNSSWTATGVELNPTLWAISSIRRWTSLDAEGRRRTRFVLGDMFNLLSDNSSVSSSLLPSATLDDADAGVAGGLGRGLLGSSDAVMIFGVKSLMGRVASLLREGGARPGTYVLSYRFRLPLVKDGDGVRPSPQAGRVENGEGDEEGRIDATLVYDVEDMRIYVLNGNGCGVDDDGFDGGPGPAGEDGDAGRGP